MSFFAYSAVIFNGPVSSGKGGDGLIKGDDGDFIWNEINISKCISNKKINVKNATISIKGENINVEEKIPLSYCIK